MGTDHLRAAIYARVSSEQQAKDNTIASQLEALKQRIEHDGLGLDPELCFIDEGWGASSIGPGTGHKPSSLLDSHRADG
jgi:hypothetical protein